MVAVPPAVVTAIGPLVAPLGTEVVILRRRHDVVRRRGAVPNFTLVAPVKFVPVIVTEVPIPPLGGEKELIVGTGITVNAVPLVAMSPAGKLTAIGPDVAPAGTATVICVAELTV